MVDVEVEFDYEAELGDELSIKVGELIKDVKRMDGGWWEGSLNGRRGVFPDNFVKVRSNFRHIKIRLFSLQPLDINGCPFHNVFYPHGKISFCADF